ncbi:MAG: hypothetical protein V4631_22625 [Pseudomonadota bacterium]
MSTFDTCAAARLEREVEREREQRHRNDDARSGADGGDELRLKDARESALTSRARAASGAA